MLRPQLLQTFIDNLERMPPREALDAVRAIHALTAAEYEELKDYARAQEQLKVLTQPKIDGFEHMSFIKSGKWGSVYRARDILGRDVALKVLRIATYPSQWIDRIRRVIAEISRVHHSNLAQVYQGGTAENQRLFYYSMDFLDGGKIAPTSDWREVVKLIIPLARAVDLLHQAHIYHCDIKPSNVVLRQRENGADAVLVDFDLCQMEQAFVRYTDRMFPTPQFSSPEQVRLFLMHRSPDVIERHVASIPRWTGDDQVDRSSDVYALSMLLYFLLRGRTPFAEQETKEDLFLTILQRRADFQWSQNRGIPAQISRICEKSLELEKAKRHASAADFADDLQRTLDELGCETKLRLTHIEVLRSPIGTKISTLPEDYRREFIIGREGTVTIVGDRAISRQHARIYVGAEGQICVEDCSERRHGVVVNDRRHSASSCPFDSGDCIGIGNSELRILYQTDQKRK